MANENITVGTRAIARFGRHEINVEVIAVENGSYLVRNDAGREFNVAHLTVADETALCKDDTPNPVPESERRPEKKLSLFEAVITALQGEPAGTALNTRELVALAIEKSPPEYLRMPCMCLCLMYYCRLALLYLRSQYNGDLQSGSPGHRLGDAAGKGHVYDLYAFRCHGNPQRQLACFRICFQFHVHHSFRCMYFPGLLDLRRTASLPLFFRTLHLLPHLVDHGFSVELCSSVLWS